MNLDARIPPPSASHRRIVERPYYHLTPPRNWCNDPNGLLYDGERYHMFYQHHPDAPVWGPMHWGHAVSSDLYRWEHLPIALFPDEDGTCFSGSAVMHEGKIWLIYTNHPPADEDGTHYQSQCIAYSDDGITFQKYEGNPVLPNQGEADFRDPYVFRYAPNDEWIMVLAVGDHVAFYASRDLISWEHRSDFGPAENGTPGVWECPSIFPLELDGQTYWILVISMGTTHENGKAVMHYFVGSFDGEVYQSLGQTPYAPSFDLGTDHYAAVPFNGVEHPTMIGWALNWLYADATPTQGYCGQMSVAREMYLFRNHEARICLGSRPVPWPEEIMERRRVYTDPATIQLASSAIIAEWTPSMTAPGFQVALVNDLDERVVVSQDNARVLTLNRRHSSRLDQHFMLETEKYSQRTMSPETERPLKFILIYDRALVELFADDGTRVMTFAVYPEAPYSRIEIEGLPTLQVVELKQNEIDIP